MMYEHPSATEKNSAESLVALEPIPGLYDNTMRSDWYIGLVCNYACTYCNEWKRSPNAAGAKIIAASEKLAQKVHATGKKSIVLLAGGEPSFHPDIEDIAAGMASHGHKVIMVSNGSKKPELYLRMARHIRGYTFSIHFEYDVEKTLRVIEAIQQAIVSKEIDCTVNVHVMMTPGYFEKAKEVIDRLQKKNIAFILRRVRPRKDENGKFIPTKQMLQNGIIPDSYFAPEELDFLMAWKYKMNSHLTEFWQDSQGNIRTQPSNANSISMREINRFTDWTCWIGIDRLFIYPEGEVYRNSCKVGGSLGNVFTDFTIPSSPVICTKKTCNDAWSINISKIHHQRVKNILRAELHA